MPMLCLSDVAGFGGWCSWDVAYAVEDSIGLAWGASVMPSSVLTWTRGRL